MTSKVAATEDTIINRIKRVLADRVRTVEYAPPDWDAEYIKRILPRLPGVFVIFGGGPPANSNGLPRLDSRWTIVAATKHVQDAKLRARGDVREIGCYEMLEIILPALHGMTVFNSSEMNPDSAIGTLEFTGWENDMALQLEAQALMTQSLSFTMPMSFDAAVDDSQVVPFVRFHAEYDVGQRDGAPRSEDMVVLQR